MSAIVWRSRGGRYCKGDVAQVRQPDGSIVVTCNKCALDYTIPAAKAVLA